MGTLNEDLEEEEELHRFTESRDQLFMPKTNKLIFLTEMGHAGDVGALNMQENNQMPVIYGNRAGQVVYTKRGKYYVIGMVIRMNASQKLQEETLEEGFGKLLDIINERKIKMLSIAKGPVGDLDWSLILALLKGFFHDTPITFQACLGLTRIPAPEDRERIMKENHGGTMGGHKGITKTYRRIRTILGAMRERPAQ